jgi:Fic family protein
MKSLGVFIGDWRSRNNITMQELSALTGIDQALISKYESGKRLPSEKNLLDLAAGMNVSLIALRKAFLSDRIVELLKYEENALEILALAEPRIQYLTSKQVLQFQGVSDNIQQKLAELDTQKNKWNSQKPLSQMQLQKMNEYFDVNYTFDSNRIEGNTLTLQETHLVVNEGITIGGKSMREHLEAINHYEAVTFIKDMVTGNEDITKRSLLDIHRLVLKSIDSQSAGTYRKVGVRISGSKHIPPDALQLEELMDDFFLFYQKNKLRMHPVILAAEMHERLVSIHPFIDGNGRTARLLMNFILLKNGFTIAILKGDLDSRLTYYRTLEEVQVNNNPEPFYELIISKVEESLIEHLSMVK